MLAGRVKTKRSADNGSYWMSYSDMMAALLLMFVLLLFLSFNRYVTLQETKEAELRAKQTQLSEQELQLTEAQSALTTRESELSTARSLLNTQQLQLGESQLELTDKTTALNNSLAQLILQQAQIEEQKKLLAMSQEEIDAAKLQLDAYSDTLSGFNDELSQREILLSAKDAELLIQSLRVTDLETLLNTQKQELSTQAQRIDELVGVRSRIIEQLRDAFRAEGIAVNVDTQTGAINLQSNVFFDTNQAWLKDAGKAELDRLIPIYVGTLMQPENRDFVAEIIIEGHTDSSGTYEHNLELSQQRALAVVNYCLGANMRGLSSLEKLDLRTIITANGRSYSQLVRNPNGTENMDASRRVEIKFRLKDAEMIDSLNRLFEGAGT